MTIVEKAAYLKGLTEGLGVEPESRDGKLWSALNDLLSDMAHEIEDLQASSMDYADVIDDICEDLAYLEELTSDLELPEDYDELDDEDDYDGDEDDDNVYDLADYGIRDFDEDDGENSDDGEDEEVEYDGVMYDVTCPSCGEEISFDEETLEKGSITCPSCGEVLEFDLGEDKE